jgi:hypothetical protein
MQKGLSKGGGRVLKSLPPERRTVNRCMNHERKEEAPHRLTLMCKKRTAARKGSRLQLHVAVGLGLLAEDAFISPSGPLSSQAWPHTSAGDKPPCGPLPRVGDAVQTIKNSAAKADRNERPRDSGRDVAIYEGVPKAAVDHIRIGRSVSRCHRGGRMRNINAWYLNTHMVYL